MRKNSASYMLYMTQAEKDFITEMAWREKRPVSQYVRELIRREMNKNPNIMENFEKKDQSN